MDKPPNEQINDAIGSDKIDLLARASVDKPLVHSKQPKTMLLASSGFLNIKVNK